MTRQEVGKQYTIVQGYIRSPGKFEGEELFVPALWDEVLNGFGDPDYDENGEIVAETIEILDKDPMRVEFPEMRPGTYRLYESEQGFVYCSWSE